MKYKRKHAWYPYNVCYLIKKTTVEHGYYSFDILEIVFNKMSLKEKCKLRIIKRCLKWIQNKKNDNFI